MLERGLWRSRWAAVGAAIAVSLGAGGILFAQAAEVDDKPPTLEERIEMRESMPTVDGVEAPKQFVRVDDDEVQQTQMDVEVAELTTGAAFHAISPYRTIDSRTFDGFLLQGDRVRFTVLTDQFNKPMIPSDAVAVTYNLTVVQAWGPGYLTMFPAGTSLPSTSSINFVFEEVLANGGVVALGNFDEPGQVAIYAGGSSDLIVDVVVDITGYYTPG